MLLSLHPYSGHLSLGNVVSDRSWMAVWRPAVPSQFLPAAQGLGPWSTQASPWGVLEASP